MKTLLLTFVLSLFCACSFSQKITGKWSCDKEVVRALMSDFEDVSCTYKFKKNGTFIIKIDGGTSTYHSSTAYHQQIGTIRIKGHYTINNGQISTIVKEEGVEADALEILDDKDLMGTKSHSNIATKANWYYDVRDNYAKEMKRKLLNKLMAHRYLWDWDKEPITITKKELKIGKIIKCRR